MEVRAKKALGQHFLTDQSIAKAIVAALQLRTEDAGGCMDVLEIGPGMGVLSQYLLERQDVNLKMIEIDTESVEYLEKHFDKARSRVIYGDFLKLDIDHLFAGEFNVIGNFPYNISSQIFFRILDYRNRIPQTVCMIQKEVAERIAEKPGSKTYGILFKNIVKTSFGQRRKTLRNSLKPLIAAKASREGWDAEALSSFTAQPVFELRPERLSVEDFIALTNLLAR